MDENNILSVGQAVANTAMAILSRWGTIGTGPGRCWEVQENSGTIQQQSYDTLRIGPNYHNWSSDWVTLLGSCDGDKFTVHSIEGNPFSAAEWLEKLALFLAGEDFANKVKGSISRMKKVTAALK